MQLRHLCCLALASLTSVWAAQYTVEDGRIQILSSTGSIKYGHSFYDHADSSRKAPMSLDSLDTLKFTFTLVEPSSPPTQLALAFSSPSPSPQALVIPLKLRKGNKAKLEVDFARPPVGLLGLGRSVDVRLLVSSLADGAEEPLDLYLGVIEFSEALTSKGEAARSAERAAAPAEWHVERYAKQSEVEWTFPSEEKGVSVVVSGLAAGGLIIGAPWLLLLTLLSRLRSKLVFDQRRMTAQTHLFLALLASFLVLAVAYWTRLRLFQALPWLAGLSLVTSWIGRNALSERQARRLSPCVTKASKAE